MGRSFTPPLRIEFVERGSNRPSIVTLQNTMIWHNKYYGKPTAANLEAFVMKHFKSFEAGGCNEQVSKMLGYVPYPSAVWIVRQSSNAVVAEWKAGMFQVW